MVRLRAPHGGKSFSYGGVEYAVGDDGHVEVEHKVAAVLQSHGFVDPSNVVDPLFDSVKDQVAITRDEIVSMLSDLGIAVTSSVTNMQTLVDALKAACKAQTPQGHDEKEGTEPKALGDSRPAALKKK